MPQELTEKRHMEEFLVSEANGSLSRETITVASGQNLKAGTPIQLSGGKAIKATGARNTAGAIITPVIGIISKAVDATGGDVKNVPYIARLAEVNGSLLQDLPASADDAAAVKSSLADKFIIYR